MAKRRKKQIKQVVEYREYRRLQGVLDDTRRRALDTELNNGSLRALIFISLVFGLCMVIGWHGSYTELQQCKSATATMVE